MQYLVDGFSYSFKLGLNKRPRPREQCDNSSAVKKNPEIAQQLIDAEIEKGHILGPFSKLPLPNLVFLPINIVPKAGGSKKFRLIHDLAYPYKGDQSINANIP